MTDQTDMTFADIAQPSDRPAGAPRYSDVVVSSRWPRPMSGDDPDDTLEAAKGFHATRIDWLYLTEGNQRHDIDEFVTKLKAEGYHVTGAVNSKLPDTVNGSNRERGRVLNADGEPVALPWLPGAWNGDPTNPEWQAVWMAHATAMVDAGIDALQNDDPGWMLSQRQACQTETCLRRAEELGLSVDSAEFMVQATKDFFRTVFGELDAYAGYHVPVSANNFKGEWERQIPNLQDLFDFGMAEIDDFDVGDNTALIRELREMGKPQIFTYRTNELPALRRFLAHTYAAGAHMIAPWDVYAGSNVPRLYTDPAAIADLYGFARAITPYLDGYEDAAVGGYELTENRYPASPLEVEGGSGRLSLFARAKPGDSEAPVVVHLLEIAESPESATIRIQTAHVFGSGSFTARLVVPPDYDPKIHDLAEETRDYAALAAEVRVTVRTRGEWKLVDVPPITPWGLLILERE
jgi:hypothetical protein